MKLLFLLLLLENNANSLFTPNGSNSKSKTNVFFQACSLPESQKKVQPLFNNKSEQKKSSSGDFITAQKAINSMPVVNNYRVAISMSAGTYRFSKVRCWCKQDNHKWDDTEDKMGQGGPPFGTYGSATFAINSGHPLGTYGSATFAINSPYFIAKNITFMVSLIIFILSAISSSIALRISADIAAFIGCKFIGAQDNLYDHIGRHYYKECYIEDSVDFIFGNGLSLYEDCHLHAITNSFAALTTQKRDNLLQETGFSFVKLQGHGVCTSGQGQGSDFVGRVSWSRVLTEQEARPFISIGFIESHEWLPRS
ncbi:hypothetical protein P3X46_015912 [Hevea brasiliensis]|uniref:pectinesterase n=1 Tax=Hevea brasiliensis TaxID=3981 RepID=A0ABQ9M1D9_HEVBR|nr:hypothetical protein P3X46_015912 [Hevea brasiliensis]